MSTYVYSTLPDGDRVTTGEPSQNMNGKRGRTNRENMSFVIAHFMSSFQFQVLGRIYN
jgi:hypothetical protein